MSFSAIPRAVSARLYELRKRKSGEAAFMRYLKEFQETETWDTERIRARQLKELKKIVAYAETNCPFYKDRFAENNLSAESIRCLDDLARFPILEKRDIQQNFATLTAQNWPASDRIQNHTGGSTSEPLRLLVNRDRKCSRDAGTRRHDIWAGGHLGVKKATIWGAGVDIPEDNWKNWLISRFVDREYFLNCGHLTEADIVDFHRELSDFKPEVILAYAQSVTLVARYLKQQGLVPHSPRSIITSAENLGAEDRELVEEVFRTKVFDRYGCREVSVIASECEHQQLHTMSECLVVEVVGHDGKPVPRGETGSIVITDLFNFAMPLIRYRVGDMGAMSTNDTCPCGRGLPMLQRVDGRISDFLVGTDGRLVSGPYFGCYLVGKCPQLGKVQILQENAGEILFKVTQAPSDSDIDFMRSASEKMLGDGVKIAIDVVESIPPSASGKQLVCRSTVTVDFMSRGEPTNAG